MRDSKAAQTLDLETKRQRLAKQAKGLYEWVRQNIQNAKLGKNNGSILHELVHRQQENPELALTDDHIIGFVIHSCLALTRLPASVAISALTMLCLHPEAYQHLMHEDAEFEQALEYSINESMRLLPPNAVMARYSTTDYVLEGDVLTPNSELVLFPLIMYRANLEAPHCFQLTRWVEKMDIEFFPFGWGKTMCPGTKLGFLQVQAILSCLFKRFHPDLPAGSEVQWFIHGSVLLDTTLAVVLKDPAISDVPSFRYDPATSNLHALVDIPVGR